jgi:hypothetical protein
MIMVTKPNRPMELTAKGTPRRQICLDAYEEDIGELYAAVQRSSQADLTPPTTWTRDATLAFVRESVRRVLGFDIEDTDDLFQQGCDRQVSAVQWVNTAH